MFSKFLDRGLNLSGLRGKTLWDWTYFLVIPIVVGGLAIWFQVSLNRATQEREDTRAQSQLQYNELLNQSQNFPLDKIAEIQRELQIQPSSSQPGLESNRIRQEVLQSYMQNMTALVLNDNLTTSEPGDPVRNIARSYTLDAVRQLDGDGKRRLLMFLYDSHLIGDKIAGSTSLVPIVSIQDVDLSGVDLSGSILRRVDLSEANLDTANLEGAILSYANLGKANLNAAYLKGAILSDADLRWTDLRGADLSGSDLRGADLNGADLADANLSGVDLGGVQNLIVDQVCVATNVDRTRGLAPIFMKQITEQCPHPLGETNDED